MGLFNFVKEIATEFAIDVVKEIAKPTEKKNTLDLNSISLSPQGAMFLAAMCIVYASEEGSIKFNKKINKILAIEGQNFTTIDLIESTELFTFICKNYEDPISLCIKTVLNSISFEEEQEYTILLTLIDLALTYCNIEESEISIILLYVNAFNIEVDLVEEYIELLEIKNKSFPLNKTHNPSEYSSIILAKLSAIYGSNKAKRQISYINIVEEKSVDLKIAIELFSNLSLDEKMFPLDVLVFAVEENLSTENQIVALLNMIDIATIDTEISENNINLVEQYLNQFNQIREDTDSEFIDFAISIMTVKNRKLPSKS